MLQPNKTILVSLLGIFLFLNGCSFHNQPEQPLPEYHLYQVEMSEGNHLIEHIDGELKKNFTVKNGLLDGPYTQYFNNDQLKSSYTFKAGILNGARKYYNRKGVLLRKDSLVNGRFEGYMVNYTKSGKPSSIFYFENGIMDDEWKNFEYYRNDTLKRVYYVDKRKRADNIYRGYYKNGQLKAIGSFKNGKPDGRWISYNEDGTVKEIEMYDEIKVN